MAGEQKTLTADNDKSVAELIPLYLEKECPGTRIALDGAAVLSLFHSFSPDLVLLGLMLPHIDDYQVCRKIRKSAQTLVITSSAKGEVFDKALGLELGANDYIIKPFEPKELVVRVRAVPRHYRPQEAVPPAHTNADVMRCEDLEASLASYVIRYEGRPVEMPSKELELLHFIVSRPNRIFTYEQFLSHIWGYEYTDNIRTVNVHIKCLCEKLKDKPGQSIVTVWDVDYRFDLCI